MYHVRRTHEAVAEVRTGFDLVAERAQFLDARPNCGSADSELLRQIGSRNRITTGRTQGSQDPSVQTHKSKSNAMSTARAEWVKAPTEIKSTPASAIARTLSRVTPPLASVRALPLHFP